MDSALLIEGLNVKVADFELKDIDLDIPKGVVVGMIGKNGAGKTTLLKSITDIYIPQSGNVYYDGISLLEEPVKVKEQIGVVYDSLIYPPTKVAKRIAKIMESLYTDFDMEKWNELMERFGLDPKKRPGTYSKGMQMKFMMTMVMARNPKMLLLDEPTAGLDPAARAELLEMIQEYMMDEEHTVIFSTHITSDLDKIADYIALIADGELKLFEEKDRILEEYALVQIPKDKMTEDLHKELLGVKENTFGFVGLSPNRCEMEMLSDVKVIRPTVEDLIVYGEQ